MATRAQGREGVSFLGCEWFLTLAITGLGSAQGGGHPHIAPFTLNAVDNGRSPLLNWPDVGFHFWDWGEGFPSGSAGRRSPRPGHSIGAESDDRHQRLHGRLALHPQNLVTPPVLLTAWNSTGPAQGGGNPPPRPQAIGAAWPASSVSLRNGRRDALVMDLQTARVGRVTNSASGSSPQVVVAATGGRVIVIDGDNGRILMQSADFGWGGTAMALADLDSPPDGLQEIVFAPMVAPIDSILPLPTSPRSRHLRSMVHVLKASGVSLNLVSSAPLGDPDATHDFHGYGAGGIAIEDLNQDGVKEIIVATLNGELMAFQQTSGVLSQTPAYRSLSESGMGAFNSIVVADLDGRQFPDKPEIYVASSGGIRKFWVQ